jgi:trimethylamine--corrinoid protein Co-methyltransferase
MEWGGSLLQNALAGVNLIHDVGYMGQGLIGHPAALVVCDEMISYTRRFMRGFELDDDHLDLDGIRRVGAGGSFLSAPQTARMFGSEHWYPRLCNRDSLGAWQVKGGKSMADHAIEKVRDILRSHVIDPLPQSVQNELNRIRCRGEQELQL